MSKIVERLRREAKYAARGCRECRCAPEETYQWLAADEIERLEAKVEWLTEQLKGCDADVEALEAALAERSIEETNDE